MSLTNQTTCWIVTDGKAGMENQCLGLAEALHLAPIVKRVKLRSPWRQLSPYFLQGLAYAYSKEGDPIAPPWPDLLFTTGRASIPASIYAHRASRAGGGRGTFTVQIQNPVISPSHFNLVVAPQHDGMSAPNVLNTRGSLHRVSPDMLKREGEKFAKQIAHLPHPRIAVLIGGSNAVYQLTPREMEPLAQQLAELPKMLGGSVMVTPSRRTGDANLAILQQTLKDAPAYVWDGQGDNPYYGMLALADYIIVTCDSVNMVSEACTTGKPVYVIDLPGGSDKFRRFHQTLRDGGLARIFTGKLEPYSYQPLNDVQLVVDRIREMMNHG